MKSAIRPAVLNDADTIAPLFDAYRQFYGKPSDLSQAREFIRERLERNESVILLAEDESGRALGFVQLFPSFTSVQARRLWVLNDLYVTEEARGHGVGRALLEAAREHAVKTGAKRLTLETMEDNRKAWALYESLGYVKSGPEVRYYTLELD
ncbi:MAG TPA: GNAT family N-acetyltransferase [Candidatus Binatia bacterium]|nr:GNAT family N-acetyltransferase [Candidatus Binatia bacterium]